MNTQSQKNKIRVEASNKLRSQNRQDILGWSERITQKLHSTINWNEIKSIHCYLSNIEKHEVATLEWLKHVAQTHPTVQIYVPVVQWNKKERMRAAFYSPPQKLTRDAKGFWIPSQLDWADKKQQFDLIVVPCLAADRQAYRLGSGRGFYDRFLPNQPLAHKIGLCFESTMYKELPIEKHDYRLDKIISEEHVSVSFD